AEIDVELRKLSRRLRRDDDLFVGGERPDDFHVPPQISGDSRRGRHVNRSRRGRGLRVRSGLRLVFGLRVRAGGRERGGHDERRKKEWSASLLLYQNIYAHLYLQMPLGLLIGASPLPTGRGTDTRFECQCLRRGRPPT